jgi:hypothetical protein
VAPTVVEGRLPREASEVMLGTRNLERAGLELGDIVVLRLGNTAAGLRIVGRGLFPEFGDAGGLGNGVYMTPPPGVRQVIRRARPGRHDGQTESRKHDRVSHVDLPLLS